MPHGIVEWRLQRGKSYYWRTGGKGTGWGRGHVPNSARRRSGARTGKPAYWRRIALEIEQRKHDEVALNEQV